MPTCPECGAGIAEAARFCAACGAPAAEARPERRKLATIVFCDLTGSTELGERHDPETVRRVLGRYFDEVRAIVARHGGTVEKFIGDAVLAAFGIPAAHEDDAIRAVRAAGEMRSALERLNDEFEPLYGVRLANHTGINTGEVVAGDASAQTLATGDIVNVAARLEQAALGGEILLGEATHALVRDAVEAELLPPLELKGKSEPVTAWRLLAIRAGARRRPLQTRLVGRADELATLLAAFEHAAAARTCRRVTVLGDAGIGKSRLVLELTRRLGSRARVLEARCLSYGEGITYWPLAELVRAAATIDDRTPRDEARRRLEALVAEAPDAALVADRVAAAVGLSDRPSLPEETAWAARRLFETLAREQPLVLVVDDVHWAEPALLDLLDKLEAASGPLLLLAAARPDLLETHPGPSGTILRLEPLTTEEAEWLIQQLAGDEPLAETVRARIRAAAEGNPLFLAETLSMLRLDPDARTIPATLQALLAARLDALPARELDLLARAAVVGQEISRAALLELADDQSNVDETLDALARKDLLFPAAATYAAPTYRFRHVLVRDAAYAATLKELRAGLHERFARWLARTVAERLQEYEEIVGYHLEQAHRYRVELAPGDPAAAPLATDAARALGNAGRRAVARGDAHAAVDLLTRAAELATDTVHRAELFTYLADAHLNSGHYDGAAGAAQAALAAAKGHNRAVELRAAVRLAQVSWFTDPFADHARIVAEAREAAAELEARGDLWGAAEAWMLQLYDAGNQSYPELIRVTQTAQQLARGAGHGRIEAEAITWQGVGVAQGPMPLGDAVAYCERMCAEASGPLATAHALHPTIWLYALAGRIEDARAAGARAAQIFHDLGLEIWVHGVALTRAWTERLAGERAREEQLLRDAVTFLQTIGDTAFLSSYAAELAITLAETGRPDEALEWAELSKANTAETDLDSQIQWRTARALALTAKRELDQAEQLAREAVDYASRRDAPLTRGQALVVLAEILQAAGKGDEAQVTAEQALDQLRRKGSELAIEQARRRLEAIKVSPDRPTTASPHL